LTRILRSQQKAVQVARIGEEQSWRSDRQQSAHNSPFPAWKVACIHCRTETSTSGIWNACTHLWQERNGTCSWDNLRTMLHLKIPIILQVLTLTTPRLRLRFLL